MVISLFKNDVVRFCTRFYVRLFFSFNNMNIPSLLVRGAFVLPLTSLMCVLAEERQVLPDATYVNF